MITGSRPPAARGKAEPAAPWWKGRRGEWLVVGQLVLIALVFLGPRTVPMWPTVSGTTSLVLAVPGAALMVLGAVLLAAGILGLGKSLTPLPYPRDDGALVQTGAYAVVRHPLYGGGLMLAYGFALLVHGPLTVLYATLLFVFLDFKSRREERWLSEKYPEYASYRRRVRKLIPGIY